MLLLDSIFKNPLIIVLLSIAVAALIAGAILIYVFVIRRNLYRKQVKDLEKRYTQLHMILTEDVEQYIARLEYISNQNLEYIHIHEKFLRLYQDILQENDRASYIAADGLRQTTHERKYNGINNLIESTRKIINEFEKRVNNIYNELNKLLQKDEEFHQDELTLQRQYRSIKEKYVIHEGELKLMEESFNKIFERIDKLFVECEELTGAARYEEASEKLPIIEQVLKALTESFDDLPAFCVRITKIIPRKIEEIKTKYAELEAKEFPLHHLKVMSRVESYKFTLEELAKNVCNFRLNNVQKQLDDIDDDIINIFKEFDNEESAKVFFDANCEKMYNATYEFEKQFKRIKRALPEYKEVYLIKDKYLDKVDELEKDINSVQTIKRDLDNYIHSSTRQPYTIIVSKINDMITEMRRIEEIIRDFNQYLNSLKIDSENAYKTICDYYIKLKDAQYVLREMAVPSYSDRLKLSFERAYAYLEQVGDIIKVKPIDVSAANDYLNNARELIEGLLRDVQEQSGQRKYAEESIVYANQYRQGFIDCKYQLNNAGTSFFEGDFTRTFYETVAIIKKMRPEVKQ